jgi:hypothetical protein
MPVPAGPEKPARALVIRLRSGAFSSDEPGKWSGGPAGRNSPVTGSSMSNCAA